MHVKKEQDVDLSHDSVGIFTHDLVLDKPGDPTDEDISMSVSTKMSVSV